MRKILSGLEIKYPVVQAPMLGVTTPDMVAAIANEGGLGSLPIGGLPPEKVRQLIRSTRSKTAFPFAVNLFAHDISVAPEIAGINSMQDFLATISAEYNVPFSRKEVSDFKFYGYEEQIAVLIKEQISIVSFTFGNLNKDVIERLKKEGVILIGTATCVDEANILAHSGVDMIVAQGIEAGGHRGSFLTDKPLPQIGLMSLLPQIVDAIHLPVIAAGGLFDRRTVEAAFKLGAQAVQLGSIFIASDESAASESYKNAVLNSNETSTELTKAFSGRWARGITNDFMGKLKSANIPIPYYTFQNSLTAPIRAYAQANDIPELISLWAGQSAGRSRRGKSKDIFLELINALGLE